MVVEVVPKKEFEYCSTCGAAEYPECTNCGGEFWHRDKGVNLNAGKGTGKVVQLCPSCESDRFTKEQFKGK